MSDKMNFETALKKLENITAKLESGDISLEDSISLFEEGIKLSGVCSKELKKAEQKIISIQDAEEESKQ